MTEPLDENPTADKLPNELTEEEADKVAGGIIGDCGILNPSGPNALRSGSLLRTGLDEGRPSDSPAPPTGPPTGPK